MLDEDDDDDYEDLDDDEDDEDRFEDDVRLAVSLSSPLSYSAFPTGLG